MDYRNRVQANLVYLTDYTANLVELMIHLYSKGVITASEKDAITGKDSNLGRCDALYHIISQKLTESSFSHLITALRKTGNEHVADVLTQHPEKKVEELAQKVQALTISEVTDMNNTLRALDERIGNTDGIILEYQSRLAIPTATEERIHLKPIIISSMRNRSSQTDNDNRCSQMTHANISDKSPEIPQYVLHDTKLRENPILQPTYIKELILYHVIVSGTILRKLFRNIRGLQIFKWLSFSPGGEFTLKDLDSLAESSLTDLTFKCINFEWEDGEISNLNGVLHLRLWMCKCPENIVDILIERFPELETIEFKGVLFEDGGGLRASDIKSLLAIPSLHSIYMGPWTYPAFRVKPENDPDMKAIFEGMDCPMHAWSPLLQRDSSYKWKYMGEDCN